MLLVLRARSSGGRSSALALLRLALALALALGLGLGTAAPGQRKPLGLDGATGVSGKYLCV